MEKRSAQRRHWPIIAAILVIAAGLAVAGLLLHNARGRQSGPSDALSESDADVLLYDGGRYMVNDDIETVLIMGVDKFEEQIEDGSWPDEAAHVLTGEAGPLYRIVQKENSILRIRNTIWYAPLPEPDDSNSQLENVPQESAEEIWINSFKMQLLRFHCSPLPLSWEQFEDGRNIIRYATTYSDLQSCGFNQ